MVDFCFIIVTYNSHLLITDAIKSILINENDFSSFEIIIVDNSNDKGNQLLVSVLEKEDLHSLVKVIRNPQNTGYGAGNNLGIKNANGKYIIVMNPDVRLIEPLLSHTKLIFEKNSKTILIAYRQLGGQNISFYRKPEHGFLFSGWYLKLKNRFNLFNSKKDFLSGAFFFAEKEKFIDIGLFDENIFMYNEESDISSRINLKKFEIKFLPEKSYIHLLDERPFNPNAFRSEMIALKYYIKKYNINEKKIILRNLLELRIKKKLAKLFNKNEAVEKFSSMAKIISDEFSNI